MFNPDSLLLPFFEDSHRQLHEALHHWSAPQLTNRVHEGNVDQTCVTLTRTLGKAGWLRYCVPAQYGGALPALDSRSLCLIRQTLGYYDGLADFAFVMAATSDPASGSDSANAAISSPVATLGKYFSLRWSEPNNEIGPLPKPAITNAKSAKPS